MLHQNSSSVGWHNEYLYVHELEEVLNRHPRLVVVWAHCGLSRRVYHDRYHEETERLLRAYPQLHVDLSWVGYDNVMCRDGRVLPEWVDVVERFAERVLLGSDVVGHFDKLAETMGRYRDLLNRLSDAARRRFYSWRSIVRRGWDRVNRSDFFMWRNFFLINAMHRTDVSLRDHYPLGDESWTGELLKAQ